MATAGNLVWVGFIDDVLPVVGSVKEAVEWVQAVAEDNLALAKEKLQVINERLGKKSKYDESSKTSSGYSSDSSSSSLGKRSAPIAKEAGQAAMHVASVPDTNLMDYIREVVGKKGKQAGKPPVQSRTDQKKVKEIQTETLRKILLINQNFRFNNPLEDTHERSGKGEHVINNNVVKIYHKVVDAFMRQTYQMPNTLGMDCPLDNNTKDAIQNKMMVKISTDDLYINANALIYGEYSQVLKQALTDWMAARTQERAGEVSRIVRVMNLEEAYVDPFARDKYIGKDEVRQVEVETIRNEVADMFTNWNEYFEAAFSKIQEIFG